MTTVTDADREAAEYYGTAIGYPEKDPSGDILRTAFARHREAEVAKIIAWLRGGAGIGAALAHPSVLQAIEAGEYRNDG